MLPVHDVVLEAAKAADPEEMRAALERLATIARTRNYDEVFGNLVTNGIPASVGQGAVTSDMADIMNRLNKLQDRSGNSVAEPVSNKTSALQQSLGKIEAYFLQTVLSEIMPKNSTGALKDGYADDMWRSVAAEQIANQLAKRDVLGFEKNFAPQLARIFADKDGAKEL